MSNERLPVPTIQGFPLTEALRSDILEIRQEALEWQRRLIGASSATSPESARVRICLHLRAVRPIPRRVMLQEGLIVDLGEARVESDSECVEEYVGVTPPKCSMQVSSTFLHSAVKAWFRAVGLKKEKYALFAEMGVFEHDDIITLALAVRRFLRVREDLKVGAEMSDDEYDWLYHGLLRYAQPVEGTATAVHVVTY
ncbi:hypothetical protein BDZ89DRAFT_1046269 [Hymenopellis radicata]|nr:hypothetical protein BDZ89DRAFT_1046269 [Hymenopellis radicata]